MPDEDDAGWIGCDPRHGEEFLSRLRRMQEVMPELCHFIYSYRRPFEVEIERHKPSSEVFDHALKQSHIAEIDAALLNLVSQLAAAGDWKLPTEKPDWYLAELRAREGGPAD